MNLSRGQRLKLSQIVPETSNFQMGIAADTAGLTVDFACFGLDSNGKLSDERYMTFFNQPVTPCGGVKLDVPTGDLAGFELTLQKLPASIDRLIVTAAIDGNGTMSQLGKAHLRFLLNKEEVASFSFSGSDFAAERALMLLEIYRKDGIWRLSATAQGFNGGLDALVRHFGGAVEEPPPVATPPQSKVTLSKVTLTKPGESFKISLEKGPSAPKKLVVKATWVDNGDDCDDNDDLDLRVGILLPDGRMKFIQAPDSPGNFEKEPYVRHLGDVTGASTWEPATETVEVNPGISRCYGGPVALVFSVYSALDNGAVAVSSMKPKMRMEYGAQTVECAYDFAHSSAADDHSVYTYVIGLATIDGDSVTLQPSGNTSQPGSENTPWLIWNNNGIGLTIDGPAVFKGSHLNDQQNAYNEGNPKRYS